MSYLSLAEGIPDFSKAVISFWFRVPQESIDAARIVEPYEGQRPPLTFCIPLLTFGKEQKGRGLGAIEADIAAGGATIYGVTGFSVQFDEYPLNPCYVAIDCSGEHPRLQFNIQMGSVATGTNIYTSWTADSVLAAKGFIPQMSEGEIEAYRNKAGTPGTGVLTHSQNPGEGTATIEFYYVTYKSGDLSSEFMSEQAEYFYVSTPHEIEPDQWHHLLLSFDVSLPLNARAPQSAPKREDGHARYFPNGAEGVDSHAMLWYAIDDVDYRGRATPEEFEMFSNVDDSNKGFLHRLGPFSVDYGQHAEPIPAEGIIPGTPTMNADEGGDPNGILTDRAWSVSTAGSGLDHNLFVPPATYDYEPQPIPAKDEIGLPASARYVEHVHHVEMAEFQLFAGVTLDTEDERNRRAFVDADGKPVPPNKSGEDGFPGSIELLGQRPDILLRRSSNWKNGKNTGSTGTDEDGEEISAGQFKPTGGIATYKPDPSLEPSTG